MSKYTLQAIVIAMVSVLIAIGVLVLARSQKLSFRYTIGWMLFLGLGAVSALLLPAVQPVARQLGVTPGVVVSSFAVIALLAICIQLSVSISGLQEQVRSLAEESALLRTELLAGSDGDEAV
jgi:hypothetical protein